MYKKLNLLTTLILLVTISIKPLTADITTFQPDATSGKDAWFGKLNPDNNYGNDTSLVIENTYSSGQTYPARSVIYFKISSIPQNSNITAATLKMWCSWINFQSSETQGQVTVRALVQSFDESTVTWNNQPAYDTGNIQDYVNVSGQFVSDPGWHKWEIKNNLVQNWVNNPSQNYGLLLKFTDEDIPDGDNVVNYYSSDYTINPGRRPKLVIYYDPPPSAPSNFKSTNVSTTSIVWKWKDTSDNETGFIVCSSSDAPISSVLPPNTTSWTESNLSPNTLYSRKVKVFNAVATNESEVYFVYTLARTPSSLQVNSYGDSITLKWNGNNCTRFGIERAEDINNSPTNWINLINWDDGWTSPFFTDKNLAYLTKYWYRVYGYNGDSIPTSKTTPLLAITKNKTDITLEKDVFNPEDEKILNIKFYLEEESKVEIKIYSITGDLLKVILKDQSYNKGLNIITCDLNNDFGSGVYWLYLYINGNQLYKKRFIIIR